MLAKMGHHSRRTFENSRGNKLQQEKETCCISVTVVQGHQVHMLTCYDRLE